MPRPLRVFLCHASQDKPAVRKLHRYLKQHGIQPWLDEIDLLPGENWEVEIPQAIYASDVILICLSKNSINKEGYVQKEISFALDKALEKSEGTIFIIPAKLEECDVPRSLNRYQWVDLFRPDSNKRLLLGLNKRVTSLGSDVSPVILDDTRQRKSAIKSLDSIPLDRDVIEKALREKWVQEQKEKEERERTELISQANVERENTQKKLLEFRENEKRDRPKTIEKVVPEAKKKTDREKINRKTTRLYYFPIAFLSLLVIGPLLFFGYLALVNMPMIIGPNVSSITPSPLISDLSMSTSIDTYYQTGAYYQNQDVYLNIDTSNYLPVGTQFNVRWYYQRGDTYFLFSKSNYVADGNEVYVYFQLNNPGWTGRYRVDIYLDQVFIATKYFSVQ